MYHPSQEAFREKCNSGNLIPVYREILADSETPVSAFAKVRDGSHSFLLESVVGGEKWAAYSFIGVAPRAVLSWHDGEARVLWWDVDGEGAVREASWQASTALDALSEVMGEWKPVSVEGLPRFWGGAVGWLSYDVVRSFEDLPAHAEAADLPELCMVITDTLVIFDNLRQTIKVVATPFVPRPEKAEQAYKSACRRIDEVIARLRTSDKPLTVMEPGAGETEFVEPKCTTSRAEYCAGVDRAKEYIRSGDIFQVVLSQRYEVPRERVDDLDLYRALRVINPSPYMFHLEFPQAVISGASPETLVRAEGTDVEVRPIAGTRRRGQTPAEDQELAAELLADEKENAEHLMLVDLGRNDVGRVAETGSVNVPELRSVEKYSHVMHLVSSVKGTLKDGLGWREVIQAAFPAGTLSGAPKIRAMEIIEELEPHRRGIYGGAIGYISYEGNVDLAIAIRTLVATGDKIFVQAGAGIVHDSVAADEHQECINKARGVLRAVELAHSQRDDS